jgi:hypothetical protein
MNYRKLYGYTAIIMYVVAIIRDQSAASAIYGCFGMIALSWEDWK